MLSSIGIKLLWKNLPELRAATLRSVVRSGRRKPRGERQTCYHCYCSELDGSLRTTAAYINIAYERGRAGNLSRPSLVGFPLLNTLGVFPPSVLRVETDTRSALTPQAGRTPVLLCNFANSPVGCYGRYSRICTLRTVLFPSSLHMYMSEALQVT